MRDFFKQLSFIFGKRRKIFSILLVFLSTALALAETIGLGAIMPFVAAATNPSIVQADARYKAVADFFGFQNAAEFVIAFGLALIAFYLFRAALLFVHAYLSARFAVGAGEDIKRRLFVKTLELSYADFARQNAGKLVKSVMVNSQAIASLLRALLALFAELFVFIALYATAWFAHWKITLVLSAILIVKIAIVLKAISRRIHKMGVRSSNINTVMHETLQSAFGNFKFIKITGNAPEIADGFSNRGAQLWKNSVAVQTLSALPRISIETLGFVVLCSLVIYVIARYQDASAIVPIVSMFALILYRLLPSAQRITSAFNEIQSYRHALLLVFSDLRADAPKEGDAPVSFAKEIALQDIGFRFDPKKPIINKLTLTIPKGRKIGFCGASGGGKSTLVDLICGVYEPQSGAILIDGEALTRENIKNWRKKIGYIPQDVYLFDGSVAENVAFGKPYDEEGVTHVLRQANIYDFLLQHEGVKTRVGDGGILLSGGQKQRIAIARALYGNPDVLVLDEATSALDNETEAKIMDEIYDAAKNKTLLVVAHRLSTLSRCDEVYTVKNGALYPRNLMADETAKP
ncbi:MAG: ABC transporter ATP-binding protein/permease [Helicobacteraceae bacterium]|jgi:ABC-type multidrug transport system fused ATPase/permease subunit|nr:ABC transporter ATP-binding protein/permease [Helicobacteraceae bacterium]